MDLPPIEHRNREKVALKYSEGSTGRSVGHVAHDGSWVRLEGLLGVPRDVLVRYNRTSATTRKTYVRFSELIPGVVIRTPPRLVTAKEMVEFASRYDSQWFHVDPVRASEGRWKGLIASGWHTCAIAMELMVQNVLSGSEAFGSSGSDSIKWLHPVRPEDTVALRFEVLRSSKSPSGRTGILLSKSELWNQNDRLVFTMQGTTLFDVKK
jgi:acyl dehydratase